MVLKKIFKHEESVPYYAKELEEILKYNRSGSFDHIPESQVSNSKSNNFMANFFTLGGWGHSPLAPQDPLLEASSENNI